MTDNIPGRTADKKPIEAAAKKQQHGSAEQTPARGTLSNEEYLDMTSASAGSAGDMTGLIPAAPKAGHELDSYNALYSHDPATRERGRKQDWDDDDCG